MQFMTRGALSQGLSDYLNRIRDHIDGRQPINARKQILFGVVFRERGCFGEVRSQSPASYIGTVI